MLTQEQAVEIRVMARRGEGIRAIARQAGCSRNTVRRYLRDEAAKRYKARAPRPCKLDDHKVYLAERVRQASPRWIPATVLLREIQERGYNGGVSALKAWPGQPSCSRIMIISEKPKSRKQSAVIPYWMPIHL